MICRERAFRAGLAIIAEQIHLDDVLGDTLRIGLFHGGVEPLEVEVEGQFATAFREVLDLPVMGIEGIAGAPVGAVVLVGSRLRVVVGIGVEDIADDPFRLAVEFDLVGVDVELGRIFGPVVRSVGEFALVMAVTADGHAHPHRAHLCGQVESSGAQPLRSFDVVPRASVGPGPVTRVPVAAGVVCFGRPDALPLGCSFAEVERERDRVRPHVVGVESAVIGSEFGFAPEHGEEFGYVEVELLVPVGAESAAVGREGTGDFVPLVILLITHEKHRGVVPFRRTLVPAAHAVGEDNPVVRGRIVGEIERESLVRALAPAEEFEPDGVGADGVFRRPVLHGIVVVPRRPGEPDHFHGFVRFGRTARIVVLTRYSGYDRKRTEESEYYFHTV